MPTVTQEPAKSPLSWDAVVVRPVEDRRMTWRTDGRNNGKPVWKMVHGDYRARVNIGFDTDGLWSGVVNEMRGKMGFASSDEAKAWCERYILDSINHRLAQAAKAQTLYSFYQANPTLGIDPEFPQYVEFVVVDNYGGGRPAQKTIGRDFATTALAQRWIEGNGLERRDDIEICGVREDGSLSENL